MQIEIRPKITLILICTISLSLAFFYYQSKRNFINTQISILSKLTNTTKGELDSCIDEIRTKRNDPTDPACLPYSGSNSLQMATMLSQKYASTEDHRALRNTISHNIDLYITGKADKKEGCIYIDPSTVDPVHGGAIIITGVYKDMSGNLKYITSKCMIDFDPPKRIEMKPLFTNEEIQAMQGPIATFDQ